MHQRRFFLAFVLSAIVPASACVLVEDFEGYGSISTGDGGTQCAPGVCPAGGNGPAGPASSGSSSGSGSGGAGAGGSGAGGSVPLCAAIPCGSDTLPCMPVEIATSAASLAAVDPRAVVVTATANGTTKIKRLAKPGCPAMDGAITTVTPSVANVVSDGTLLMWSRYDSQAKCGIVDVQSCAISNCVPLTIPLLSMWPEQGALQALEVGADYFYFMFQNGLIGRVSKTEFKPEAIFTDPVYQPPGTMSPFLLGFHYRGGKLSATRYFTVSGKTGPCEGGNMAGNPGILSMDANPGGATNVTPTTLAYPSNIAGSDNYVYFQSLEPSGLLFRVARTGGAVESLAPVKGYGKSDSVAGAVGVIGSHLYFEVKLPSGENGVIRLPIDQPNFALDGTEELVAKMPIFSRILMDDDGVYWGECVDPMNCVQWRIFGVAIKP